MFLLTQRQIDVEALRKQMNSDEAGAFVSFEGRVRNFNEGKSVSSLEYEAYEALAVKEANKILQEARQLFSVLEIICVHRVGALQIGDIAVWVGVISRHRGEGFDACRYVIDHVKARVPIWKKEFYVDGSSTWVNCAECAEHAGRGIHLECADEASGCADEASGCGAEAEDKSGQTARCSDEISLPSRCSDDTQMPVRCSDDTRMPNRCSDETRNAVDSAKEASAAAGVIHD